MATVSLQTVFDSARRALETGAADKAIGIAQHILVHFPRMIEGHRLLGEAYLNANEPEQAVAAFEHVLQADPENVAAYYGLGLAQQSLDQRPAAITAFERALEIQPNLGDLRTQLMRLYNETPGSAGQFRLSRAGLGRLYARGGMFGQAIDEFRAVLDADPERDDVKVALAEALWRDGQEDEATDFCRDVLDRRPDLAKPTVLLGYMLFAAGQPEGEALWRRVAEQDASMALAHSLFDILPPIRLEDPVLPEFDEAEWRAQEARRAVEQPLQPSVAAVTNDDDFFADSWLSSAGATPQSNSTRIYDAPAPPAPSFASQIGGDDDDLLASLLGFADTPQQSAAPAPTSDFGAIEPFGLDDWGAETSGTDTSTNTQPQAMDDFGLPDATPSHQAATADSVKPFSFDDWAFEDDVTPAEPASSQTSNQSSANDFNLSGVEAFSFDDDDSSGPVKPFSFDDDDSSDSVKPFTFDDDDSSDSVKPFSFESESSEPGGVMPFSLEDDDLGGIGGIEPFSLDAPSGQASTGNSSADAGLGAVQPFSFDEWGLDDSEPALGGSAAQAGKTADDDLGDFKPFSLDELSLDSLDTDVGSSLSGPHIGNEAETTEDAAGFSWEEPGWRTQRTSSQAADPQESESIFAKLMRNRPQDQPPASEAPSETVIDSVAEDEPTFFSLDEEPLRIDLDADQDALPAFEQPTDSAHASGADQTQPAPAGTQPAAALATDAFEAFEAPFGTEAAQRTSAGDDLADLTIDGFGETDQLFSWDQPEPAAPSAPAAEQEAAPFSLADLGFSDDELAALDIHPETSAASAPAVDAEAVDMTPFSLADLGLSDEELASLDLQGHESTELSLPEGVEAAPFTESTPTLEADTSATDDVDMTPFSLTDLGLSDEELAALDIPEIETSSSSFVTDTQPEPEAISTPDPRDLPAAPGADDVDMTPFSLADLGLSDDELALLTQTQQNVEAEAAASPFATFDLSDEEVTSDAEAAGTASEAELADWFDLPAEAGADMQADQTSDSLLDQPQSTDQDQAVQPVPSDVPVQAVETSEEPAPFSLADLGLSDDELALFEHIQSEQQGTGAVDTPDAPEAPIAEANAPQPLIEPAFEWPFAEADRTGLPAEAAPAESFAEVDATDLSETAFEWPFAEASHPAPAAETEQTTPFMEADAILPTDDVVVADGPTLNIASVGDESAGVVLPGEHNADDPETQPLPMDLPEGAQAVAATAAVQPPVAAAPIAAAQPARANHDLTAIHAQLAAEPENHGMRLAVARMSQHTNDLDQAVEQYKQLIKRGELLDEVVVDLQDVIVETDDAQLLRRLHRLLGDAYMKQNRFREAMDEYSWTLARRN